jgi:sRNA-binding regulator protein Hfq
VENMDKNNIQLTSTEIGSLWGQYVNGTMTYMVNKYMVSIIEDDRTKAVFQDAIQTFEKQRTQITKSGR